MLFGGIGPRSGEVGSDARDTGDLPQAEPEVPYGLLVTMDIDSSPKATPTDSHVYFFSAARFTFAWIAAANQAASPSRLLS